MKIQGLSVFLIPGLLLFYGSAIHFDIREDQDKILVPQSGYNAGFQKMAILRFPADSFYLTDNSGSIRFRGIPGLKKYWSYSDEWVQQADFSSFRESGEFTIRVFPHGESEPVTHVIMIADDPYQPIAKAAVKALYFNRCSYRILPEFGDKWARKSGHPDNVVYVHGSAATPGRPEGTVISSRGGWYDAGDYNKYIVNSGISTYTLLLAYELYPQFWKMQEINIPESGNNLPDILDEALFNLRWMLTMQDTDGGVYHKLTTKSFEPFIMPEQANEKRFVVQKSTAATLDFAATMAHASLLFAGFPRELPGLADSCSASCLRAFEWCRQHPDVVYKQPMDISTGEYGDRSLQDEWFWAATEVSLMSGSAYPDSLLNVLPVNTPSWGSVAPLGIISTLLKKGYSGSIMLNHCRRKFFDYVDHLVGISDTSAYPVSLDYFAWGSNSDVANQGMMKMIAFELTRDNKYLVSAENDMNYITGLNPTGYCFITGFGSKSPRYIHHRVSAIDGIPDPVPGFLAGGPNLVTMADCPEIKRSILPALSYADSTCSYSTNEIAINWNAPLVFLSGALSNACHNLEGK